MTNPNVASFAAVFALTLTLAAASPAFADDGGITDSGAPSTALDGSPEVAEFPDAEVSGSPTAAADSGAAGCDGKQLNQSCTSNDGTAGFCVLNPVDGSDDLLICDVDGASDVSDDGCNVGPSTNQAGGTGGSVAIFALVMVAGAAIVGRKRRR